MSVTSIMDDLKRRMDGAISAFKHELSGLRTGRASASLLEPLTVEAYGSVVPIKQVANISVLEPRMLSVSVWDKTMVGAVERAIRDCGFGLNPIVDGMNLRIPLPELNEERRKELVKIAHQYAEQARVAIRHVRRDGMDNLKKLEKEGEISQDEARSLSEKVQKLTDDAIADIDKILIMKETEIMQV
ncbi:ribosome-recycling factor [Bartonella bacilliformis Peru38]|uniref:Ribosome-recycling factor n=2 Tax=Bartonella bacilliformis TaxID=774 RepID=RRF_BARBK|nr:ribosome recycling factor [Bartonella bacilliformis]Q8RT64.1 RecName: Full=Ribosome-recycling factor; Short=RRF; AltName: Full=Ribosome-releasing factor [Bartonella bacilliformis KC583]AAL82407.1 ribosome recycling factor [Bartonella bacilliformis]ABM45147.1 ribosome recycling factor [Bartonella bacilliformis KC583]AMG85716.1 ribosome-recycling factor [Bartonella bacilliformis]EKS44816.1 ribosome recycling factor [Bartonella bacilliformis INS]EYS89778.1 ribosome-recycling factor [Bartonell